MRKYVPLLGARASNSSKNIIQGLPQLLARKNKSLTAFSLAPMYLLSSSGPWVRDSVRIVSVYMCVFVCVYDK